MGRRLHEGQHLGYGRWSAHLRDRRLLPQRLRPVVNFVADGNYAWEWWYQFQVTDNISVTPAIYYLSRPYGDLTNGQAKAFGGNRGNDRTTVQQLRWPPEDHL